MVEPTIRDVVFGSDNAIYVMNDFLVDFVFLFRIMYLLQDKSTPSSKEGDVSGLVDTLYKLVREGKDYHFAGIRNVPTPFLTATGRFLLRSEVKEPDKEITYEFTELSEEDAKKKLAEMALGEFSKPLAGVSPAESPYKEFKQILERYPVDKRTPEETTATTGTSTTVTTTTIAATEPINASAKDAILFAATDTREVLDRVQEHELGNKVIFNMASQVVSTYTTTTAKRVEAALTILHSLDDAQVMVANPLTPEGVEAEASMPPPTQKARFLIRKIVDGDRSVWTILDAVAFAIMLTCFVFEVYLEKGISARADAQNITYVETPAGALGPIDAPEDFDVLFGRGGLTNAHPGNRRFRDDIALHRPDYIRAIKMDKPAVARKIVRSIRHGTPPGRFLKKSDDGKWYDVGDRTAAEKTSQGLRERSNAEKRQRHALREALRIRKQDMSEGEDGESGDGSKKTPTSTVPTPVPILNYVGTNLAVPLSLGMKEPPRNTVKRRKTENGAVSDELNTEGLPPNAVDEDGNILVTDYDILCGRGGLTNHHKGNKRFRDIVALHRPDYVRAPKIQKPSVARVIVRAIRNGDPPGRFLRKDEKTGKWIDVGDKKAAEKTSQALREKTNEEREKQREPGSTPTSLLPSSSDFLAAAGAVLANIPITPNNVVVTKSVANDSDKNKQEGPAKESDEKVESTDTVKEEKVEDGVKTGEIVDDGPKEIAVEATSEVVATAAAAAAAAVEEAAKLGVDKATEEMAVEEVHEV